MNQSQASKNRVILGIVGIVASAVIFDRILSKIKETVRTIGGWNALRSYLRRSVFVDVSCDSINWSILFRLFVGTTSVIAPGYGSDHDLGRFSGYICYEDYYGLLECVREVDEDYRNAVKKARIDRKTCSRNCTLGVIGGGIICFGLGFVSGGTLAPGCAYTTAGASALCLAYCQSNLAGEIEKASCDADLSLKICFKSHVATVEQVETLPDTVPFVWIDLIEMLLAQANRNKPRSTIRNHSWDCHGVLCFDCGGDYFCDNWSARDGIRENSTMDVKHERSPWQDSRRTQGNVSENSRLSEG